MVTATASGWGTAADLLAAAGVTEDPAYYGSFTAAHERAALTVPMSIQAAWAANDADAFAEVFADNGSLLLGDRQLTGREEIRSYMAEGFRGGLKGARVRGWPMLVQFPDEHTALVVTDGGIIMPGEADIAPARRIRALWVVVKEESGRLRLMSHQSCPVGG